MGRKQTLTHHQQQEAIARRRCRRGLGWHRLVLQRFAQHD